MTRLHRRTSGLLQQCMLRLLNLQAKLEEQLRAAQRRNDDLLAAVEYEGASASSNTCGSPERVQVRCPQRTKSLGTSLHGMPANQFDVTGGATPHSCMCSPKATWPCWSAPSQNGIKLPRRCCAG